MKIKLITLLGILMLAVLLAACDSSTTTQTNTPAATGTTTGAPAGGPAAFGTPGAQRPAPAGAASTCGRCYQERRQCNRAGHSASIRYPYQRC